MDHYRPYIRAANDNGNGPVPRACVPDANPVVDEEGNSVQKRKEGTIHQKKVTSEQNINTPNAPASIRVINNPENLTGAESISGHVMHGNEQCPNFDLLTCVDVSRDESTPYSANAGPSRARHSLEQPDSTLRRVRNVSNVTTNRVKIRKYFRRTRKVRDKNPQARSSYWEVLCIFCKKPMQSNAKTMENHFCGVRSKLCPAAPDSVREDAKCIRQERCQKNRKKGSRTPKDGRGNDTTNIREMKTSHPLVKKLSNEHQNIGERSEPLHDEIRIMRKKLSGRSSTSTEIAQVQRSRSLSTQNKAELAQVKAELRAVKEENRKFKEDYQRKITDLEMQIRSRTASGADAFLPHGIYEDYPDLGDFSSELQSDNLDNN